MKYRQPTLYRVGMSVWLATFIAVVAFKVMGAWPASWAVVLFPIWGPPAFYVALFVGYLALVIAFAVVTIVLLPWIRAWQS